MMAHGSTIRWSWGGSELGSSGVGGLSSLGIRPANMGWFKLGAVALEMVCGV